MSRAVAEADFTEADFEAPTRGVSCRKDKGVLAAIPDADKHIGVMMATVLSP